MTIDGVDGGPFARLVAALEAHGCRPRLTGDKGRANCPSHDDRKASLIIGRWGDGARVRCFVCGWRPVLAKLGLDPRDLYGTARQSHGASRQKIIASYSYVFDADGKPLVERVRFGPRKGFAWRSRQPGGRWQYALHGADPGLYRVEHLIDQRLLLVTEGEKACEAAVGLGFAATCGPSGASTWRGDFSATLWRAGARVVVVLPDQDDPGRRFAKRVAASCSGFRASLDSPPANRAEPWAAWPSAEPDDEDVQPLRVKLLPLPGLPAHGDLYDWVHAGGTASALADLISTTPDWTPLTPDAKRQRTREQGSARVARWRDRQRARQAHGNTDAGCNGVTPEYQNESTSPSIPYSERYRYTSGSPELGALTGDRSLRCAPAEAETGSTTPT